MRVGVLLGRFQPLHPGHVDLMRKILLKNDSLVICIGSAQLSDPFTIEERHDLVVRHANVFSGGKPVRIFDLIDPTPIDSWPEVLVALCEINKDDHNTFYRSDLMDDVYVRKLGELGVMVEIVPRESFYYKAPDGLYYLVSSSSEIKALHRKLGTPLKQRGSM